MKLSGIYLIKNVVNNKLYIGQSENVYNRWKGHKKDLNNKNHCNLHLQRAWDKYGELNFIFDILELLDFNSLDEKEIFWIETFNSTNRLFGYNLRTGGSRGKHNEESKRKISKSLTGKIKSKETIEKMSKSLKGRIVKHSEEAKLKMSISKKGKIFTDLHKLNISKASIGKKLSDSHKIKISDSNKGKEKHNKETRDKIGSYHKNKIVDEITRKKISNSHLGKKLSKQHKKNISIGNMGRKVTEETKIKRRNSRQILSEIQVIEILSLLKDGKKNYDVSILFNVSISTIKNIKSGKFYSHITGIKKEMFNSGKEDVEKL